MELKELGYDKKKDVYQQGELLSLGLISGSLGFKQGQNWLPELPVGLQPFSKWLNPSKLTKVSP